MQMSSEGNSNNTNDLSNFTITGSDFTSLHEFAKRADVRMIFDLNVLRRHENGTWDDGNAKEIIAYAKRNFFQLDWQLGNGETRILEIENS